MFPSARRPFQPGFVKLADPIDRPHDVDSHDVDTREVVNQ
jgi:hypothetical protein